MMFFAALFSSVLVSLALTPVLCTLANRLHMVDIPNERKVHSQPIPRVGGIAMAAAAFATILIGYDAAPFIRAYLLSAAILVAFGVVDDFRELSPRFKFAGQGLAALTMIFWGGVKITSLGALLPDGVLLPDAIAVPLTLIAIVGATNAINLADGLDGLAGGISLLVFSGIAYLGYVTGNVMVVFLSLAIIGGVFGFLRFNTHPASIFMGDTGSQFLGFSAVTLAIGLTQQVTVLSPMLPLLLLGFPILDTLNVMVTRMAQGRSPFSPDKNHFHHNLMEMGFLHTEAVVAIYALQTLLIAGAIIFRHYSDWLLLGGYLGFSLMVLTLFRVARARAWQPNHLRIFDLRLACLKRLRREGLVIRPGFRVYRIVFALLLLATVLLATGIPVYAGVSALFLAAGVLLAWGFIPGQLPAVLRVALYLFVPPAVYFSDTVLAWNLSDTGQRLYHLSFGVLAVLVVLTTKFSRRSQGFKSSPMDFLIITLAVIAPNLPDLALQTHHLGLVAAKIIILYYGFEVLISELRGKCDGLAAVSVVAMVLFALL